MQLGLPSGLELHGTLDILLAVADDCILAPELPFCTFAGAHFVWARPPETMLEVFVPMSFDLFAVRVPVSAPSHPAEEGHLALEVGDYQGVGTAAVVVVGMVSRGRSGNWLRFHFPSAMVRVSPKVIEGGYSGPMFLV